jgi:hypothetical protein
MQLLCQRIWVREKYSFGYKSVAATTRNVVDYMLCVSVSRAQILAFNCILNKT